MRRRSWFQVFLIILFIVSFMLTSAFPWLGQKPIAALERSIPTLSYTNGQQKVGAPDWSKITWSSLPPIQSPGWIQVPPNLVSELGYNPSRTWQAGQTPDTLMMLGDVADAFGLQEFSLANVAQITGGAANVGRLKDLKLTSWQTIGSLVEAIPGLENLPISQVKPIYDLVSRFSSGNSQLGATIGSVIQLNPSLGEIPLGQIDLSRYSLESIPGLVYTPFKEFTSWQQSLISQVPGLNLVPFSLFPITPGMGVGAVAQADVVWGSAERGDPTVGAERFVSGSATDGGTVPVNCEAALPCAYLELSDLAGAIGPRHGQRWASGETQKVKGGRGVLAAVNNGWEPTGRLVYGDAFKVVLTKTHESTGTAEFGLYLRACIKNMWVDLGCTPYFIGPIPWIPVREKDLVILAASDRPQVNPPEQYQEQIDQILAKYQPQTNPVGGDGSGIVTGQFINPASGYPITSGFGPRRSPCAGCSSFHPAIDLGTPMNTPIQAADGGTVIGATWWDGYGLTVVVAHGNGMKTRYSHLNSINVVVGQSVSQGQEIGRSGQTGYGTGPHLDFGVYKYPGSDWRTPKAAAIDPRSVIKF